MGTGVAFQIWSPERGVHPVRGVNAVRFGCGSSGLAGIPEGMRDTAWRAVGALNTCGQAFAR